MRIIDFRSDTVTKPTENMRKAMFYAEVGDDVYEDDTTVKELEKYAAEIVGKEASLFVPTGTMGNLLCIMTHTAPGEEVILEEKSHIYLYEVGGLARIAGLNAKTVRGEKGIPNPQDIEEAIRKDNIHFPKTGLICLENSHNMAGGNVIPLDIMEEVYKIGIKHNIPVHLDGARLFNAATYLEVEVKEIAKYTDSVMFCLSKALSAPIGSLICGKKSFVDKARKNRKLIGGGMRQVGVVAAAGIIALKEMPSQLKEDHLNARYLIEGLQGTHGIFIDEDASKTNIVRADFSGSGKKADFISQQLKANNILANATSETQMRFVTHKYIMKTDIDILLGFIKKIIE